MFLALVIPLAVGKGGRVLMLAAPCKVRTVAVGQIPKPMTVSIIFGVFEREAQKPREISSHKGPDRSYAPAEDSKIQLDRTPH